MVVASTTRYIGNYGELKLTLERNHDDTCNFKTAVSCPYGNEWPIVFGGPYDIRDIAPVMHEMRRELFGEENLDSLVDRV